VGRQFTFRESAQIAGGVHDPERGVVRGVRVLGLESRNGRRYLPEAIRSAVQLYEGAPVYIDHPEGPSNARLLESRFGRLRNVTIASDGGLTADLQYNPKHRLAPWFAWAVDHDPEGIGLSHNATGVGRTDADGVQLVESIRAVHSVDLVDGPATVKSLFEQEGKMADKVEDAVLDDVTDDTGDDTGDAAEDIAAGDETGEDTPVEGDWRASVAELAKSLISDESLSIDDTKKKLLVLLKLLDESGAKESGDEEVTEQLRSFSHPAVRAAVAKLDELAVRERAREKGLPESALTPVFVAQLRERAAKLDVVDQLIEDRRQLLASAKNPKSSERSAVKADKISDLVTRYFS
jgi:hypothetical protein